MMEGKGTQNITMRTAMWVKELQVSEQLKKTKDVVKGERLFLESGKR